MKLKLLFCWCMTPLFASAQKVTVTQGAVMTINKTQTLPSINNQGHVVLTDNSTLTLMGTASGTGLMRVTPTSSLTVHNGSGGIVYFDPSHNTLRNLSVYGGLVLGNTLNITAGHNFGSVKLMGTLFSDSFLVLKSDLYGTARIDSSAGNVIGLVTAERYIPPRRSWRFMTVPFASSTQSINQAWQEGYTNTTLACPSEFSGTPGYGTHITYNGANGYDPNVTQNPSIIYFAGNHWHPISSTLTTKITDYPAYALFPRGDRTICLTQGVSAVPVPTTLRAAGEVYIGTASKSRLVLAGEYLLEGNPYASSIDLLPMTLRSSGIVPETWWIWDPGVGETGVYVAYSAGMSAPATPNYPDAPSTRIIQSGQGYILQAAAPMQTVRYEEEDKVATNTSSVFARPLPQAFVRIQLLSQHKAVLDGVAARFMQDTAYKTLPKFWNFNGPDIALQRNGKLFSIETRTPQLHDTSFLSFGRIKPGIYVLEVSPHNIENVQFFDRVGTTALPIVDTLWYAFEVTDSASYMDRFIVVYGAKDTIASTPQHGIYPNPVRDKLYCSQHVRGQIHILDVLGRTVIVAQTFPVDCTRLSKGMYFLRIHGQTIAFQKR